MADESGCAITTLPEPELSPSCGDHEYELKPGVAYSVACPPLQMDVSEEMLMTGLLTLTVVVMLFLRFWIAVETSRKPCLSRAEEHCIWICRNLFSTVFFLRLSYLLAEALVVDPPPSPPKEVFTGAVVRSLERSRDRLRLWRAGTCTELEVSM